MIEEEMGYFEEVEEQEKLSSELTPEKIKQDVENFLANGGEIQIIGYGVSGRKEKLNPVTNKPYKGVRTESLNVLERF